MTELKIPQSQLLRKSLKINYKRKIDSMNYALLAIKQPTNMNTNSKTEWDNFLETLETKISTYENLVLHTPTLLQFSLETSLKEFLEVQHLCKQAGYPTITSFLKKFPIWITS